MHFKRNALARFDSVSCGNLRLSLKTGYEAGVWGKILCLFKNAWFLQFVRIAMFSRPSQSSIASLSWSFDECWCSLTQKAVS